MLSVVVFFVLFKKKNFIEQEVADILFMVVYFITCRLTYHFESKTSFTKKMFAVTAGNSDSAAAVD